MGLTNEQLEMRRTGVTATDMVTLAGEGYENASALQIYNDKLGIGEPWKGNRATRAGEHMESLIMEFLSDEKRLHLTPGVTERHAVFPWLLATPDRNVMVPPMPDGTPVTSHRIAIAEAKFVGYRMAHEWGDDVLPPAKVVIQVTVGMMVTRQKLAHVAALIGTEPKFYEVEFNQALADALTELADNFWNKNVIARVPPMPEANEAASRALREMFPRVKGDVVAASPEIEFAAKSYFAAKRELEDWETKVMGAENVIKQFIGERAGVEGDGWQATWSERKGSVSYKNALESAKPLASKEWLDQFRGADSRMFLCKPKKAGSK